jgi:hypothetical protein
VTVPYFLLNICTCWTAAIEAKRAAEYYAYQAEALKMDVQEYGKNDEDIVKAANDFAAKAITAHNAYAEAHNKCIKLEADLRK